jgi:hypothetical protein
MTPGGWGSSMRTLGLTTWIGSGLFLAGVFVPSPTLIQLFKGKSVQIPEELLLGATLFKINLVVLGLLVAILGRIYRRTEKTPSEQHLRATQGKPAAGILAGILLAASALRLYKLNSGLWLDEITTLVVYARTPFGELISTYVSENQHFLYSILAHLCFLFLGESAWALRLPAVLFGVGSIWALYLLARQVGDTKEALCAAALLAFSYHHVWFSQNARGYTGLLFWTLLAGWLFLRSLTEGGRRSWSLYALAAALGIYTHMTMVFVVFGHFITYVATLFARRREPWRDRWAGLFLGFCLGGVLTTQIHAFVLPQILSGMSGQVSFVDAWKRPAWTLLELLHGLQIGFAGWIAAVAALLLFGAGLVGFVRRSPVVLQLLLVPSLIGAVTVMGVGHHLWPRFFFFCIGFGVLIVVRGVMVLADWITRAVRVPALQSVWVGVSLCTGLILASASSLPPVYGPKQDYDGALAFMESAVAPGDTVVTVGLASFPYQEFYQVDWEAAESVEVLNSIRSRTRRTWLIYTLPPVLESVSPDIMFSIRRDFRLVRKFPGTVREGDVFVCVADAPPSESRTSVGRSGQIG